MLFGIVAFVVATAWWFMFFHDILGEEFQIARECFYWTPEICSLKVPAAMFTEVPIYDPGLLWLSGILFVVGLFVRLFGLARR